MNTEVLWTIFIVGFWICVALIPLGAGIGFFFVDPADDGRLMYFCIMTIAWLTVPFFWPGAIPLGLGLWYGRKWSKSYYNAKTNSVKLTKEKI